MEIAVLRLKDSSYDIDGDLTYHIKKDKDFKTKLSNLVELLNTYENFDEIDDFISNNFELVEVDTYEYYY